MPAFHHIFTPNALFKVLVAGWTVIVLDLLAPG